MAQTIDILIEPGKRGPGVRSVSIPVETLKSNLEEFSSSLAYVFQSLAKGIQGATLEEVTVEVAVGTEGSVKLFGSGGSASAEASISLTYRLRSDAPEPTVG